MSHHFSTQADLLIYIICPGSCKYLKLQSPTDGSKSGFFVMTYKNDHNWHQPTSSGSLPHPLLYTSSILQSQETLLKYNMFQCSPGCLSHLLYSMKHFLTCLGPADLLLDPNSSMGQITLDLHLLF